MPHRSTIVARTLLDYCVNNPQTLERSRMAATWSFVGIPELLRTQGTVGDPLLAAGDLHLVHTLRACTVAFPHPAMLYLRCLPLDATVGRAGPLHRELNVMHVFPRNTSVVRTSASIRIALRRLLYIQ